MPSNPSYPIEEDPEAPTPEGPDTEGLTTEPEPEVTSTISEFPEAVSLHPSDALLLDQPNVIDPITGEQGVTRKVFIGKLKGTFNAEPMEAIADEIVAREEGDAGLQEQIETIVRLAEEETEAREEADTALQQQIDTMEGRGGYLTAHDFGSAEPSQEDLTNYALDQISQTDPLKIWNGTHVKNLNNSHTWVLTNTPDTDPVIFEWTDDGLDNVNPATNTTQGTVQGNPDDPEGVSIEGGIIRVVGDGNKVALAEMVDGYGRNLMTVLGKTTIIDTIADLKRLSNNSGQIDASGVPKYDALRVGDYIDGIDLSAIPAEDGGTAGQPWNDTYKNNRIMIAGFNTYKGFGDTENTLNHILFVFRHCPMKKRMNPTNDNAGGYQASDLWAFLEGLNGDGTGDKAGITTAKFLSVLRQQLGDQLYTINKHHSKKGASQWDKYTLWPPTEPEVFGNQSLGDELNKTNTNVQFPIYAKSGEFRSKRYNGVRYIWWLQTPVASTASTFCLVHDIGGALHHGASNVDGVSPAFCVA